MIPPIYEKMLSIFIANPTGQFAKEIFIYCHDHRIEPPQNVIARLIEILRPEIENYRSKRSKGAEEKHILLELDRAIAEVGRKEKMGVYRQCASLLNTSPEKLRIRH